MNTNVAGTVEISLSTNWKRSGRQIWRYLKNSPPASKTCQVVGNRCRIILKRLIRQRCQQWLVSAAPGLEQFGALPPPTPKRSNSWLLADEPASAAATLVLAAAAALPKISRCRWFGSFELFGCFSAVSDNHRPSLLSRKDLASYILFKLGQLNCKW